MTFVLMFLLLFVAIEQGFILFLLLNETKNNKKKEITKRPKVSSFIPHFSAWNAVSGQDDHC